MQVNEDKGYVQAYGKAFARAYNEKWSFFAKRMGPRLLDLFAQDPNGSEPNGRVLDVCCGTGQLAGILVDGGFKVIGIDLSPHMIRHAEENNAAAIADGLAEFHEADAASFAIDGRVRFAVSLYDALNHLRDADALYGCFESVYRSLASPGKFVFDLNTPKGLLRWNGINIEDDEYITIINRGIYAEGADRAYTSITGFIRGDDGRYDRFREVAYETVFDVETVKSLLTDAGFVKTYVADASDLGLPVIDVQDLPRLFYITEKE